MSFFFFLNLKAASQAPGDVRFSFKRMGGGEGGRVCFGLFSFPRGSLDISCRGRPLPAGPGRRAMPGCRRPAGPRGVRAAPLRPGRPRWSFCARRPLGKAGDRRPSAGGGEAASGGSRSTRVGKKTRDLIFKTRQGRASWVGTKPGASGRGTGSVTPPPPPPPHSSAALQYPAGWARWARAGGRVACRARRGYAWGSLQYRGCYVWGTRLEGAENGVMGAGVVS